MAAPSCEAELITRENIFKLKFNRYLEACPTDLVISKFMVTKVEVSDGTVTDVYCVGDCKRNGHNATLWAPGFMLANALDTGNQVVKWLDVPV